MKTVKGIKQKWAVNIMPMSEVYRFIEGMHYINWSDEKINKIICYIGSGDMKYIEDLKAIIEAEKTQG